MKYLKLISIFCMVLISSITLFSACNEPKDDRFYEQTNTVFAEFIQEVCYNDNYKNGITYGNNINNIIDKIQNDASFTSDQLIAYTELKDVYDNIFVSSFYFLSAFNGVFLVVPTQIPNSMKTDYQNFEETLKTTKQSILDFSSVVNQLDNNMPTAPQTQTKVLENQYLQFVREYKRKLIDLCEQIVNMSNEFVNICQKYIYPEYNSFKDENGYLQLTPTQITNQKTIANIKSVIDTINPAIAYLNAFDGDYVKLSTDKFFVTLNKYINFDFTNTNSATIEELDIYLTTYKAYKEDLLCFYTALESINMKSFMLDYNFNIDLYAQQNPENFAYVTKIFEFTNTSISLLYNANKNLYI